ncbi:hypothetical protein HOU02_gp198 [Caulobacter phage CcrBL9]|uniref:Uncharacterized protein n=1 Tax=Caulobacter phage CcrBL9 TaxID=2283270 RepID=A0A385EFH0_9CAUD|nr:hypothetical protein HOU02_gp198 [Caulobacter phage CcrBL9]AXQ69527.1 hypothetical protein CcrBL9_gp503 [Caulobacter phage CcrBL9]
MEILVLMGAIFGVAFVLLLGAAAIYLALLLGALILGFLALLLSGFAMMLDAIVDMVRDTLRR